jgi:hypothetical protein
MAKATPKQTTPKGAEIPVPKRKDFYANLDKMVKAPVPAKKAGPGASQKPLDDEVVAKSRS